MERRSFTCTKTGQRFFVDQKHKGPTVICPFCVGAERFPLVTNGQGVPEAAHFEPKLIYQTQQVA